MNRIEQIVNDIEKKKIIATSNPGENSMNYSTKVGKIKRAKIDLEDLYLDYRKEVQLRSLFIIVTGSKAKEFAKIAEEEFYCFQLDSNGFYEGLIEDVNERLYANQSASSSLFDILGKTLEERAMSIGILGYPALIFESKYKKILSGKEDLLALLKKAFNEKVGIEMLGLDAVERATKLAINSEQKEKKTLKKFPIVMVTEDETIVKDLAKGLSFVSNNVHIVGAGAVKDKKLKQNFITSITTSTKATVEKSLVKINEISK